MCISPLLLFHRFILRHEEDAYEVEDKFILLSCLLGIHKKGVENYRNSQLLLCF